MANTESQPILPNQLLSGQTLRETGIFSEKLVDDVIANNDYCVDLFKSHAVLAYTGSNSWYSVVESVYVSEPDNSFIILTKNCGV